MKRALIIATASFVVACGSTTTGSDELTEAPHPRAENAEVTPSTPASRGEVSAVGEPLCMAFVRCGCWSGCARVEPVRAPEGSVATHRLVEALPNGEQAGALLYVEEHCYEGRCQRVCVADTADARCDDGGLSFVNETCTGACAPSEAPYHCVTLADRCERVEHPIRAPAPP